MRIATGEEEEKLDCTKTLRATPAMVAGIAEKLCSMEDVIVLIDARSAKISGQTMVG